MVRRVCVIGCCGAGKTVLADRLGARLGLPVMHLDGHYWLPGWRRPDADVWRQRVEALATSESWVLDGNYAGTLDVRLPRADLVVVVDYPRRICMARVLRRWARLHGKPYAAPGCPERTGSAVQERPVTGERQNGPR